jgi:hypothetical protein
MSLLEEYKKLPTPTQKEWIIHDDIYLWDGKDPGVAFWCPTKYDAEWLLWALNNLPNLMRMYERVDLLKKDLEKEVRSVAVQKSLVKANASVQKIREGMFRKCIALFRTGDMYDAAEAEKLLKEIDEPFSERKQE